MEAGFPSTAWAEFRKAAQVEWSAEDKAIAAAKGSYTKIINHLQDNENLVQCEVPSNGLCLYYCICMLQFIDMKRKQIKGNILRPYSAKM